MRFAEYIGDSVSPLALIYCGFILYELGLKNLRLMPGLPVMLVIRLGAFPGDLLAILYAVRCQWAGPGCLCGGERSAGGQPSSCAGWSLWRRRGVRCCWSLLVRASLSSDGPLFNAGSGMRSGPRTSSAPNWLALSLKNGWNKKPASIITRRLSLFWFNTGSEWRADGLGCLQQAQIVFPAQYPLHGPVQQLLGDDIVLQCLEDLGNLVPESQW